MNLEFEFEVEFEVGGSDCHLDQVQMKLMVTTTGTCTSDRGVPEIKGFSGRSVGRPAERDGGRPDGRSAGRMPGRSSGQTFVSGARVVSGAEKKFI